MKAKMLITLMGLLLSVGQLYAQETPFSIFQKYNTIKTTFITKSMLGLVPDLKVGSVTIKEMKDKLDQVEIYTNESKDRMSGYSGKAMRNNAVFNIKANYDIILSLQEESTEVMFYSAKAKERKTNKKTAKTENDDELITDLVMINYNPRENVMFDGKCTVIRIVGKFTAEDIQKFAAVKAK